MQIQSLGQEVPLEKGMAAHSSVLAWRMPWTEEPGGLQSMGLQRVRVTKQQQWNTDRIVCRNITDGHTWGFLNYSSYMQELRVTRASEEGADLVHSWPTLVGRCIHDFTVSVNFSASHCLKISKSHFKKSILKKKITKEAHSMCSFLSFLVCFHRKVYLWGDFSWVPCRWTLSFFGESDGRTMVTRARTREEGWCIHTFSTHFFQPKGLFLFQWFLKIS